MVEIDPQTFRLDVQDPSIEYQRSLHELTAVTHELVVAHNMPDQLTLAYDTLYTPGEMLDAPDGFAPVLNVIRRGGSYAVDACLPSLRAPRLVNAVEYKLRLPGEDEFMATVAIDGISRLVYPMSGQEQTGSVGHRPRSASVVNSLANTLELFARYPSKLEPHWSPAAQLL